MKLSIDTRTWGIYQLGYALFGVGKTVNSACRNARKWTDGPFTLAEHGNNVIGDMVARRVLIVNNAVYRWDDLAAGLPREIVDHVDARDYESPIDWFRSYLATVPRGAEYGADWLLSTTPHDDSPSPRH